MSTVNIQNKENLSFEPEINELINKFLQSLKTNSQPTSRSSYTISLETLNVLKKFIGFMKFHTTEEFMNNLKKLDLLMEGNIKPKGIIGSTVLKKEFCCGNMIRRVIFMLREEINNYNSSIKQTHDSEDNSASKPVGSMFDLLARLPKEQVSSSSNTKFKKFDIRATAINIIRELTDEVKNIDEQIFQIGVDLIHDNEILLIPTPDSKTILNFLINVKKDKNWKKRNFTCIITESYPNNLEKAQKFALKLSDLGIDTIIIPDSMVFAVMNKIGKVIIGCKQIFSNGSAIVSSTGVQTVVQCAKEFRVPIIVMAGLYKLSSLSPFDIKENYLEVGGSKLTGSLLPKQHKVVGDEGDYSRLIMVNNINDFIAAEFIDIIITNTGAYSPSFMYRVVADNYESA
ncbi:related to Translation initiation factor eIF-2B subunit beta [Hanseniaspora guilliermondii]|uniref:Translation initiation factor eIF2B subunit beta n=1 Tax=Hanseniaspora guilliermondii TaxID=56406 RepID=A0A1L0B137_9ASCO|nr:related to Translation initiation factor eIF-2B subunit beta [Hanseniaspora guilliermondii]